MRLNHVAMIAALSALSMAAPVPQRDPRIPFKGKNNKSKTTRKFKGSKAAKKASKRRR